MRKLSQAQLPSSIGQVLECIRAALYKRIEDDVTEAHWSDASASDSRVARKNGVLWLAHVPVECLGSCVAYDLYMQVDLRVEINRYKIQLFWRREPEGVRQAVVRYENGGRHGDIMEPHLNWNVDEARTHARRAPEIPSDSVGHAFAAFCQQPEVRVDFQGQVAFVPTGWEGDS